MSNSGKELSVCRYLRLKSVQTAFNITRWSRSERFKVNIYSYQK